MCVSTTVAAAAGEDQVRQEQRRKRRRKQKSTVAAEVGGKRGTRARASTSTTFPQRSSSIKEAPYLFNLYKLSKSRSAAHKKDLQTLIKRSSEGQIRALSECSKNLLNGAYPNLTHPLYQRLARYKTLLRSLSTKGATTATKKRVLQKTGGQFFSALLAPIIASVVGTALSHL